MNHPQSIAEKKRNWVFVQIPFFFISQLCLCRNQPLDPPSKMELLNEIFGNSLFPRDDFSNAKGKACSVEEPQIEQPTQDEVTTNEDDETLLEYVEEEEVTDYFWDHIDYYCEDIQDDDDDLGSFGAFLDEEESYDAELYNHKRSGKIVRSKSTTKKEKVNPDRYEHHRESYKRTRANVWICKSYAGSNFGFNRGDPIPATRSSSHPANQEQQILDRVLKESAKQYNKAVAASTASLAVEASNAVMNQLIALQTRELTPEDYEILLLLDQSVKPKTLSKEKVNTFPCVILDCDCSDTCTICMTSYEIGESQKTLPCGHKFHTPCIDHWLTNSSVKCPLDGRELL